MNKLNSFSLNTDNQLTQQLVAFIRLYRQQKSDNSISYTTPALIKAFHGKIQISPFTKAWLSTMLHYQNGVYGLTNIATVVQQCESVIGYPHIGNPPPSGSMFRIDPKGAEYKERQKQMKEQVACLIHPTDTSHNTVTCPTITNFHKENPSFYKEQNLKNPREHICPLHGAVTHEGAVCTLVEKL